MPPLNPVPYAIFEFPVTLPSCLAIASVRVPVPMNAGDFDFMIDAIRGWRDSLIKPPGLEEAQKMVDAEKPPG